ncbi:hypothetical protein D5085_00190 [Ectothiorhodospiraceae bacterium BW-2]|nr:hypothetical protein D5085_00190 [Ectothiorhodospiraceae bacterium BW-2]
MGQKVDFHRLMAVLTALAIYHSSAAADWSETIKEGWDKTKQLTDDAWQGTVSAARDLFQAEDQGDIPLAKQQAMIAWDDFNGYFNDIDDLRTKQADAPESSFYRTTKADYGEKIDEIIAKIYTLMDDDQLLGDRVAIEKIKAKIVKQKQEAADLRASAVISIGSDKQKLLDKAEEYDRAIIEYEQAIDVLTAKVQQRLAGYGVELELAQVEVLLARVDSRDIVAMVTVFAVIDELTQQLAEITASTGENLEAAKKYYAMYLVLIELQLHIQRQYIAQLESYMAAIDKIRIKNSELINETKALLKREKGEHAAIYRKNLASQEYNLKVIDHYKGILRGDKRTTEAAMSTVKRTYNVALNTYRTVTVSAVLASMMAENKQLFQEVMSMQTPALKPFENLKMKEEFELLSGQIRAM